MPVYQYECKIDGEQLEKVLNARTYEAIRDIPTVCTHGHVMGRVYEFTFGRIESNFETHKSPATGEVVSSKREFSEQLKRMSAEATERTGVPSNFVPIDARELRHTVRGDGKASSYSQKKPVPVSGGWKKAVT